MICDDFQYFFVFLRFYASGEWRLYTKMCEKCKTISSRHILWFSCSCILFTPFFFRFLGSSLHPLSSSLPSNISAIRLYFCRPLFWRIHCVQIIATWINYPWLGVIVVYNYKSTIYPFVWLGLHSIPTNWNDFGSYCFSAIFLSLTATSTVKVK